jgi:hypothetical protein
MQKNKKGATQSYRRNECKGQRKECNSTSTKECRSKKSIRRKDARRVPRILYPPTAKPDVAEGNELWCSSVRPADGALASNIVKAY